MEPFGRALGFDMFLVAKKLTNVIEDPDTEESVRKDISDTRDVVHRRAGIWANLLTDIMNSHADEIKETATKLRDTHLQNPIDVLDKEGVQDVIKAAGRRALEIQRGTKGTESQVS